MTEPRIQVELTAEAGGLLQIMGKVEGYLRNLQTLGKGSGDAMRTTWDTLNQGVQQAETNLKSLRAELDRIERGNRQAGMLLQDPTKAMAAVKSAEADLARYTAQLVAVEKAQMRMAQGQVAMQQQAMQAAAARVLDRQRGAMQDQATAAEAMRQRLDALQHSSHKTWTTATQGAESHTAAVFKGVAAVETIKAMLQGLETVAKSALDNNLKLEASQRGLEMATGNGGEAMRWVSRLSWQLGLDLIQAADGYKLFAAAAKGSTLEGENSKLIFTQVGRAAVALGLDSNRTHGMLLALSQMVSKGKVQAEELRRQLGEHLPGAIPIFARALGLMDDATGKATAKLDKLMESGQITSDHLVLFARQLEKELGEAPEKAANSLQANLNRMSMAWQVFTWEMGKAGGSDGLSSAVREIADALSSPEGKEGAHQLGLALAEMTRSASGAVKVLWSLRDPLLGIAAAYAGILAVRMVEGFTTWVNSKRALVKESIAARTAALQETAAQAGLTATTEAAIRAESRQVLTMLATREAALKVSIALMGCATEQQAFELKTIAATRAQLAQLETMMASSRGGSAALAVLGGGWGLLALAVAGAAYAYTTFGKSVDETAKKLAESRLEAARSAEDQRERTRGLMEEVMHLDRSTRATAQGTKEHKEAKAQLNLQMERLAVLYPEINKWQKDENGNYKDLAGNLRQLTLGILQQAEARKLEAKRTLEQAEAEALLLETRAASLLQVQSQPGDSMSSRMAHGQNVAATNTNVGAFAQAWLEKAKTLKEGAKRLREAYDTAIATESKARKDWTDLQDAYKGSDTSTAPGGKKDGKKPPENQFGEELARILKERLQTRKDMNLDEQEAVELLRAQFDLAAELSRLDEKRSKDNLGEGPDGWVNYLQAKGVAVQKLEQQEAEIRDRFAQKRAEDAQKRVALETDVQERLEALEEGGWERREAAIKKGVAKIRADLLKLKADPKNTLNIDELLIRLDEGETRAKMRAWKDQVQEDMEKIRKELAEEADVAGRALTAGEKQDILNRWKARGGSGKAGAEKYEREHHLNDTGLAGGWKGFKTGAGSDFQAQSTNTWEQWREIGVKSIGGVRDALSGFYTMAFQKGITGQERWKAMWSIMAGSAGKALSDWIAQETLLLLMGKKRQAQAVATGAAETTATSAAAGAKTALAAATSTASIAAVENAAATGSEAVVLTASAVAAEVLAASLIFAAHAPFPWVGVPAALNFIGIMQAALAENVIATKATMSGLALPGFAKGGYTKTATLGVFGEAEPELLVPESSFWDYAKQTASLSARLAAGIAQSEARQASYRNSTRKIGALARDFQPPEERAYSVNDMRGSIFVDTDVVLGKLISRGQKALGKRFG